MVTNTAKLRTFALAAALAGAARSSDNNVRAKVGHIVATPYHTEDPEVAGFKLSFDVELANGSDKPIYLPRPVSGTHETTRVAVLSVESKQRNGVWKYVVQSTWVDAGSIKYGTCRPLPSGGVVEIRDVPSGLLVLKKQLAELGDEPTVRFGLWIFCRQPGGKVLTTSVTTDALVLPLPGHPGRP